MTACEATNTWSCTTVRCPTWLPLHSTQLLPMRTNGWMTLASKMKLFSPTSALRHTKAGELVAAALRIAVEARAQAVELAGRHRDEHVELRRRMARLQGLVRHHRTAGQLGLREVLALDAEGGHVAVAVVFEVFAGDLRELACADED